MIPNLWVWGKGRSVGKAGGLGRPGQPRNLTLPRFRRSPSLRPRPTSVSGTALMGRVVGDSAAQSSASKGRER